MTTDYTLEGIRRTHTETAYQVESGVYLPTRMLRETYSQAGRIRGREEIRLVEFTLNKPLSPRELSLEDLGLNDGEIVIDEVKGGQYRYEKGSLASQAAP